MNPKEAEKSVAKLVTQETNLRELLDAENSKLVALRRAGVEAVKDGKDPSGLDAEETALENRIRRLSTAIAEVVRDAAAAEAERQKALLDEAEAEMHRRDLRWREARVTAVTKIVAALSEESQGVSGPYYAFREQQAVFYQLKGTAPPVDMSTEAFFGELTRIARDMSSTELTEARNELAALQAKGVAR